MINCSVCSSGKAPEVNLLKSEGKSQQAIADELGFTRWAVRKHLEDCDTPPFVDTVTTSQKDAVIEDITRPLNSDPEILATLGLNPDEFAIVGGTNISVRELASGEQLFSYRAKVQPVTQLAEASFDLEGIRNGLRMSQNPAVQKSDVGSGYVIALADGQLGKCGTDESVKNLQQSVVNHVDRIKRMSFSGAEINQIALCYQGDEIEGIAGNYASQTATVELNLSQQLELDFELRCWAMKYIIDELSLPMQVSSVISNHGDSWVRLGGNKPVMGQSDNASTHVARLVQKTFELVPGYADAIDWHIANDEAAVVLEVSGVKMYCTHGYLEKGSGQGVEARTVNAMQKQILGDPMGLGDVKIFLTAHYHHFWAHQDRNYTVIGCPALEAKGSSKWLRDMSGIWSEPGAIGFLIGEAQGPLGFNEIAVL